MESNIKLKLNIPRLFICILLMVIGYLYYNKYLLKEKEHFQISALTTMNNRIKKFNDSLKKNRPGYQKEKEQKLKNKYNKFNPIKPKELKDSKILVTGSTRGLGLEIAKSLNKHKPILIITGRKQKNVDNVVKLLKKTNNDVYGFAVDLSTKGSSEKLFNLVYDKVGVIDILINNAFMSKGSRFLISKNEEDWSQEFNVNINSSIVLSQKFAYKMKVYKVKGRIINISSYISKSNNTLQNSGSEILFKNMLEKFTNMLAEELYNEKIAVTTIRIDDLLNTGFKNFLTESLQQSKSLSDTFGKYIGTEPKKIMPVINYSLTAPFHEISGKVLSSKAFLENEKLSKMVPSHNLKLNKEIYKNVTYTKTIKRNEKGKVYLVKQNPYNTSPRVINDMKKSKNNFNNVNTISKYDSILDNVIAKKLKIKPENIVFFRNEYDCIKKLIEILVPKYQEIVSIFPSFEILQLISYENKIEIKYSMMEIKKDKFFVPDYDRLLNLINTKTKLIYLSSPNIVSGQNIVDNSDFRLFIEAIPDNIPILIDQRFIEFCSNLNKETLNPLKYLKKENVIILRTFNNFYSIENLELTYIITNKELANLIKTSQVVNPIDKFTENLALKVYNDKYYDTIRKKIKQERKRVFKILKENDIKYLDSDTNFFLISTNTTRDDIKEELEKRGIFLYSSFDGHDAYWTLPLGTKQTNEIILDVILAA
jgi:histidinol-phosphate/aromatic aminotransferase/cobyric acid decarboxylase-like protein/short-subunit dehydrogenase